MGLTHIEVSGLIHNPLEAVGCQVRSATLGWNDHRHRRPARVACEPRVHSAPDGFESRPLMLARRRSALPIP